MSETIPIQPDAIRLRPGEQHQLTNQAKYLYTTRACCQCQREIYFDQIPPERCDHKNWFYLDRDYEAAKRVTAESVAAKLEGARPPTPTYDKNRTVLLYTPTPESSNPIDDIFSTGE